MNTRNTQQQSRTDDKTPILMSTDTWTSDTTPTAAASVQPEHEVIPLISLL